MITVTLWITVGENVTLPDTFKCIFSNYKNVIRVITITIVEIMVFINLTITSSIEFARAFGLEVFSVLLSSIDFAPDTHRDYLFIVLGKEL